MQATRVNFEDNCRGNERALSTSRLDGITTDPNSHGTYNTACTNSLHTVNEVDSKDRPEMYCHYVVSMCWTCWTFNESNNTETLDQQGNLQIQGFLMNRSCFYFSVPNLNLKFCFKMVGTVSRDLTGLFRWTKFTANYCDTFAAVCAASINTRKYSNTYNKQTNRIPICAQSA